MKTVKTKLLYLICLVVGLISCDDDSVRVDSTPEFQTLIQEISTLPGEVFLFEGLVTDPAGIKSVNFKYDAWFLDKTITKDSLPETYSISYKFKVPANAEPFSVHTIPVTITNAGNVITTRNVVVTLDKDIAAPIITINSPVNGATVLIGSGDEINLSVALSDRALSKISIASSILTETLDISGTAYNYSKTFNISQPGNYTFTITAIDATGNESVATVTISVVADLQFNTMFLTDETTDSALNQDIFGIPFTTSRSQASGETGYVFTGRYYSKAANSEVRFIPQQGSFGPFAFGADPAVPGKLVLGQDVTVTPIILPSVGYYEVSMDIRDFTYKVTPYTPSDATFDQVYILGRGIFVNATVSTCVNNNDGSTLCWHFNSGKPFTKNSNNPYLWTIDVTLKDQPNDAGVNGFILNANPSTWAPFWRVDVNGGDPSRTIPGGGNNYVFPDSALDKDYTFTFDTHLNRIIAKQR